MTSSTTIPQPIYLNPDQPLQARVQDLISRHTFPEKSTRCATQPRLFRAWEYRLMLTEAKPCVVLRNGRATVFPQAISMAATWDNALVERIAFDISNRNVVAVQKKTNKHVNDRYA